MGQGGSRRTTPKDPRRRRSNARTSQLIHCASGMARRGAGARRAASGENSNGGGSGGTNGVVVRAPVQKRRSAGSGSPAKSDTGPRRPACAEHLLEVHAVARLPAPRAARTRAWSGARRTASGRAGAPACGGSPKGDPNPDPDLTLTPGAPRARASSCATSSDGDARADAKAQGTRRAGRRGDEGARVLARGGRCLRAPARVLGQLEKATRARTVSRRALAPSTEPYIWKTPPRLVTNSKTPLDAHFTNESLSLFVKRREPRLLQPRASLLASVLSHRSVSNVFLRARKSVPLSFRAPPFSWQTI